MDSEHQHQERDPSEATSSSASVMLDAISIRGFRCLADVELDGLDGATVLIGANGSGKSNFIRFFEMLSWMLRSRKLEEFVARHGGADDQLFMGNKVTPRMEADIGLTTSTGTNEYSFALSYGAPDRFIFSDERWRYGRLDRDDEAPWHSAGSGHTEARIAQAAQGRIPNANPTTAQVIGNLLKDCGTFQFHDTSASASMKQRWDVSDSRGLRADGGNLAAVLHRLQSEYPDHFEWVGNNIRRILPNFDQFIIEEEHGRVMLRWSSPTNSDKAFGAHLTSDGSLRFFALVTLLNLPPDMLPRVILLDEPELGLHPAAVSLIGSMIESLATQRQVIVATQSPQLVDAFELDEVVVMELEDSKTAVRRLSRSDYEQWLEENYTTGELWQMNLLGGRP